MFELFTDEARAVVVRAQEWTREWGMREIGTAGMLAALAGGQAGEAGVALGRAGVTPQLVQEHTLGGGHGSDAPTSGHIPFSRGFKDTMARAAQLAMGPAAHDDSPGDLPDDVDPVRTQGLPEYPQPAAARPRAPVGREILRPGHLLLALLDDPDCTAVTVLRRLGVDLDGLRAETRELLETGHGERSRAGQGPSARNPPQGRHRPAGTSRFPPPSGEPQAPGSPLDHPRAVRAAPAVQARRAARRRMRHGRHCSVGRQACRCGRCGCGAATWPSGAARNALPGG